MNTPNAFAWPAAVMVVVFAASLCVHGQTRNSVVGKRAMTSATTQSTFDSKYIEEIVISTPNEWDLRIFPDGRAEFGYGSSPRDRDSVPPNTFKFTQIAADVASRIEENRKGFDACAVSLLRSPSRGGAVRGTLNNAAVVLDWFDVAHKVKRSPGSTVEQCWAASPPTTQPAR
jgi:hypothetical protein